MTMRFSSLAQDFEVDPEIRASSEVMRLWWFRLGMPPPKHDPTK